MKSPYKREQTWQVKDMYNFQFMARTSNRAIKVYTKKRFTIYVMKKFLLFKFTQRKGLSSINSSSTSNDSAPWSTFDGAS